MEPLHIRNNDSGQRLDAVLARIYPQYSRSFFQKFLKKGGVTLSGAPREPDYRVHAGQTFQVADFDSFTQQPAAAADEGSASDVVPDILFEDDALLIIDKPAGLVVHPAPGHRVGTLMDWLKRHLGPKATKMFTDPERLGLVHRLDKDTSGVLVIAKTIPAQTAISRQFRDRTVQKTYAAFVEGIPSAKTGVIDAPVGRSRKVPTRMAVSPLGRASETAFEVKETLKEVALVTLHPKTGRTHQIRVHLSAIGHPIVGDRTYGAKSIWAQSHGIHRPLLHAERLQLAHPASGKSVVYEAPWPQDFKDAHARFRTVFKAIVLSFLIVNALSLTSYAESETSRTSSAPKSTITPRKTNTLSSDIRKLKSEMSDLQSELAEIKASLERLNVADRLRDLERASLDLNAKAAGGAASVDEAKTQAMDASRKLKTQQEVLDQLRDQVDRLQQQLIKAHAVEAPAAPIESPANPEAKPSGTAGSSGPSGSKPRPWGSRGQ